MSTQAPQKPSSGRLDAELVRRGLARSRTQAAAHLKDGRVSVDGVVVTRSSTPVTADSVLTVQPDVDDPGFVSRAAFKLDGVLGALGDGGPPIAGAVCLDVGASTGGFTDVLLRRGARTVIALDVGHDQLVPVLREDPRVVVMEKFNARQLTADDLPARPRVVVADVSFISLTLILPALVRSVPRDADLLLMVKPQFEVGRERLGHGGVVRSDALRGEAIRTVTTAAAAAGVGVRAVIPSPLPGPHGNREYFVWFTRAEGPIGPEDDTIERAVAHPLGATTVAHWAHATATPTTGGRS
ncbi:23S rRNA (cytidine1920-2'-O)/16S rRNA (cytidine1409-2'-O)-methyltransferase [Sanguibacter gelidistatuariae]|uniref:23S rRNA (Cytidine1920-2'-O)/16S rRNA (Cytidine1409-2'-O)-methyltransferase n=1 Tax=Sanguibacter gelidistatuariae TaxID=1814289 RepID=A0A1G6TWP3_9MICO|nr:TlyA family RNA methyltransferase [Sanguibacter gelidistatuariae]SDD32725.1 23S rRNA (cytidine1920-2'-O)/16S rRNA (cytidine1409-2'-O)-methyltransferase [Sanguibacter gelidistatuariae]